MEKRVQSQTALRFYRKGVLAFLSLKAGDFFKRLNARKVVF